MSEYESIKVHSYVKVFDRDKSKTGAEEIIYGWVDDILGNGKLVISGSDMDDEIIDHEEFDKSRVTKISKADYDNEVNKF